MVGVLAAASVAAASPAAAHGVGERSDLPLPLGVFTWGAAIALVVSFVALRVLWPKPRLDEASVGRPLGSAFQTLGRVGRPVLRVVGLVAYLVVLTAAWFGLQTPAANIAPVSLYVVFWVGAPIVVALFGDVWAAFNPFDTIAAGWERLGLGRSSDDAESEEDDPGFGHWTAAAGIASFVWLELAYHDPASPRAVAIWLTLYSAANLVGAFVWGRRWLRYGEGFAALFGLIAALAAFFRDDEGVLRIRPPMSGLSDVVLRAGTPALILVTLGSTGYDGLSGTRWWADLIGQR
ncbi:MAG: fenitrothion hydrolase, partial [Actinomycetota bacterium]